MPALHVHLDESGNFTFSSTGSQYYVFTAAWTYDPAPLARDLTALRFSLLKQGHNLFRFHATEDKQVNRDAVVNVLTLHENWHFAAVVIEKVKVNPVLREPHRFYPKFATSVLKFVFRHQMSPDTTNVLVFTDTLPVKQHREATEKVIKMACRQELNRAMRFQLFHHPSASNSWIQAVDYCSWSVFRKWEQGNLRTYERLRQRLAAPELDALQMGTTRYY